VEEGELLFRQVLFAEYAIVNGALPPVPIPRPSFPIRITLVAPGMLTVHPKPVPVLVSSDNEPEGMAKEVPPGIAP
jgi:hypothetical protein